MSLASTSSLVVQASYSPRSGDEPRTRPPLTLPHTYSPRSGDEPYELGITSRIFRTFFWGLARLNSPLPEIRPSWEAFAHPRSGCLLWFLVTKRILSTHETSSHEDSTPTDHFRRAGARASKCPAYRGCLIKTKINEAINYFRDEASGYL